MNLLIRHKKHYLDTVNTETGKWGKDSKYLIFATIEYYDSNWNPTGFYMNKATSQVFGTLQMFPSQWDDFRSMLEIGSEAYEEGKHEIRWLEEEL